MVTLSGGNAAQDIIGTCNQVTAKDGSSRESGTHFDTVHTISAQNAKHSLLGKIDVVLFLSSSVDGPANHANGVAPRLCG